MKMTNTEHFYLQREGKREKKKSILEARYIKGHPIGICSGESTILFKNRDFFPTVNM